MERAASKKAVHCIQAAMATSAMTSPTDADLLDRFVRFRDEAAFELLVWRYRRLILGVCRRALRQEQDAEDAFQATFLVLARKAATVGRGERLAGWLHTVACRVTHATRAAACRRASHERSGVDVSAVPDREPESPDPVPPDLLVALDREIAGLPRKYQEPLVLCYLEEMTYRQAADRLAVPVGTLSARLAKAKVWLQTRLTRRGFVLPAVVPVFLARESARGAESELIRAAAHAAVTLVSGVPTQEVYSHPYQLAETAVRSMYVKKLKVVAAAALVLPVVLGAAFALASGRAGEDGKPVPPAVAPGDKGTAIRGTWTQTVIDQITVGGMPQPPKARTVTVVITDDRIQKLDGEGFVEDEMTYTLNPTTSPASIDLASPRYGAFRGIYRLDGERLRIVYPIIRGAARPADFPTAGAGYPSDLSELDLKKVSPDPKPATLRFANDPGCFWMHLPTNPSSSLSTNGFVLLFEKDADGAAVLTLAAAAATDAQSRAPEYRPVLFDAGKKRFTPVVIAGGGISGGRRDGATVVLTRWRMDPKMLPADKVELVGIEQVTAEAHRAAALAAAERARKRGVEVFPYPEIGKAYTFAVQTSEGKTIASKDLKGKVVVIDWWATWCSPCMQLLPAVKSLYEARRNDGLEVIGVNLDRDLETAAKACRRLGAAWPQVHIPNDEASRELWLTSVGTEVIPLVLVLDRKGVLRAVNPPDLKAAVGKLLDETKDK